MCVSNCCSRVTLVHSSDCFLFFPNILFFTLCCRLLFSLTHSRTHSFTHSLTHSVLTHSLTQSLTQSLTHSLTRVNLGFENRLPPCDLSTTGRTLLQVRLGALNAQKMTTRRWTRSIPTLTAQTALDLVIVIAALLCWLL